ncbi:hypothetical protein D3C80_1427380 [compost metagenome]
MIKKAMSDAFLVVLTLSFSDNSVVIVKKIGIVPNGLISVKNEVKHKSPKESKSFIFLFIIITFIM